ncbi:SRPBCC family protein [Hymenobacter monticola]|uniref:SRPBCC family protein n=1 Tax=Hymenobacter monticola TaxID=1705399 RepID=A0ABY4BD84_9BACT|nr:SRPBCC family protein [Hymenobacter monticola]UOE34615.1 SRPBCC family protein [Hymenobacter monticola]
MKFVFAAAFAAVYGLVIRLFFGSANGLMEIMSVTFLFLVPVVIGFLTIILMPAAKTTSGTAAFFKPWLTSLIVLLVTILLKIEGSICWIMIFPIFATFAGIGGLIAYHVRNARSGGPNDSDENKWQRPNTLNVSLLVAMPLALGLVEGEKASAPQEMVIQRAVILNAPAAEVWQQLTTSHAMSAPTSKMSVSALLGFPKHKSTTLDARSVGGKRTAYYEKGLYFDETITQYQPARLLVLRVDANPNAIPPAVMDEHILIGGKHLDILEDVYELESLPGGGTRLTLSSRFYINTPFNWYARLWAHYLMTDILQSELELVESKLPRRA